MVAPLALSVSNSGIVPLVPASDAVKENVGTAPALPSPAAILPDQPCIEADVSLATHEATFSPRRLIESMKTVNIFIIRKQTSSFDPKFDIFIQRRLNKNINIFFLLIHFILMI